MLHIKFHGISTPIPVKKILKGFHHTCVYEHGSHLGNVTSIISTNFHFHVPRSLNIKFGLKGPSDF